MPIYIHMCVFVAMSRDVLSVVVFTADLSLCVHINLVMSLDHDLYIYIYVCVLYLMSFGMF